MVGRIYETEAQYRLRVQRDNETKKAVSSALINLGSALGGGGVVQVYANGWADDPKVGWWFLLAVALILAGLWVLRRIQAETDG